MRTLSYPASRSTPLSPADAAAVYQLIGDLYDLSEEREVQFRQGKLTANALVDNYNRILA